MDITIREDALYIYADVTGGEPQSQLYIEIRSKPVPPNTDTTGATAAVHKTILADGTCHFRVIRSALLVDPNDEESSFPRELTVIGPITSEIVTA